MASIVDLFNALVSHSEKDTVQHHTSHTRASKGRDTKGHHSRAVRSGLVNDPVRVIDDGASNGRNHRALANWQYLNTAWAGRLPVNTSRVLCLARRLDDVLPYRKARIWVWGRVPAVMNRKHVVRCGV